MWNSEIIQQRWKEIKPTYLQKLVELVDILWARKIIVVEIMNDWGNSCQKDELRTSRTPALLVMHIGICKHSMPERIFYFLKMWTSRGTTDQQVNANTAAHCEEKAAKAFQRNCSLNRCLVCMQRSSIVGKSKSRTRNFKTLYEVKQAENFKN